MSERRKLGHLLSDPSVLGSGAIQARDQWKARALAAEAHVQRLSRELGAREASEWPGVVEGWRRRAEAAERERDEARKLLDELCEIVTSLRTAAREVDEFFDFARPGLSKFAGHDIDGAEGDPTGALLRLHDYANDADRFLAVEADRPGWTK